MDSSSSPLSSPADSPPTSPLSRLSRTPSLPSSPEVSTTDNTGTTHDASRRYPSPMSTTASGTQSPVKQGPLLTTADSALKVRPRRDDGSEDGPPPAKKRRTVGPKERTTEYLDLTKDQGLWEAADEAQLQRLLAALRKKKKIVVIAGAGISVSAGIPDFRSATGLFAPAGSQQNKMRASGKHLFDASVYKHDASTQSFHTMVREMAEMTRAARPTPFHHLLASLAHEGRLLRLYSQNIDCIDTAMPPLATKVPLNAKGPWPATVQLHGGLEKMVCTKCGQLKPFQGEIFDGPEAPLCSACVDHDQVRTAYGGKRSHGIGRLRPRFVLYNEYNPDEEAIGNVSSADLKARPDAVLVVGTSLKVPGTRRLVKEMCQVTRGRRDGFTAWINIDSEPKGIDFKDCWDLVVRAPCDKVASEVALPPWDVSIGDDYLVSSEEHQEMKRRNSQTTMEITLPSPKTEAQVGIRLKQLEEVQSSIPTPRPSPKMGAVKQSDEEEKKRKKAKKDMKKADTKQSKISFGKADAADKSAEANKPRVPRKPKQLAKNTAVDKNKINTMLQGFKTVKNVAGEADNIKVELFTAPNGLPELRPTRPSAKVLGEGRPSTPEQLSRPASRDTISPKSVPRGWGELID
jgi:NAD+-dependent protein deacetylase SIR2